ncbi:MAG: nitroreductase family deazaflavin-dependent oxidoreductase [Intrasporangiaceae bacterium]|nr:nitroreductase family deazaflavin-dependent oxidoreductase [Intrasporangiaceae bacterium]
MSLAESLGCRLHAPNPLQRAVQTVAATRAGSLVISRTLPILDGVAHRLTGRTLPEVFAALPVVELTTTGRNSGRPRTIYLVAIPYEDGLGVIGANFGQRDTPDWVLNLESDPAATVAHHGMSIDIIARQAIPDERDHIMALADRTYDGYRAYRQRITDREVRVFVLERA